MDVIDRALPHDIEAEKSVLGAILVRGEALASIDAVLDPRDFFRDAHRRVFEAMLAVQDDGAEVDFITLKAKLLARGDLDEVGGLAYVSGLTDGFPHASNLQQHAQIVKEQSRLRQVIFAANRLMGQAYDAEALAADIAGDAADQLYDLGGAAMPGRPVSLRELVTPGMEAVEQALSRRGSVTGLATGFKDIDDMTAGMHPGNLILIAARTSVGKTALAMNIARHVGMTETVLVFSLEMSRLELYMRVFSSEARVDSQRMRTGALYESDWPKLANAMGTLSDLKLWIDDTPAIGVREVRARSRQLRNEQGLGLIVVDYIQLMRGRGKFDNRTQEVGSISHDLKAVAKELQVPIIALAQLSRASEAGYGRKARKPQLSDLRESGDLENDADLVLLIWRPESKDDGITTVTSLEAEIIVAKQRNGPTGSVSLLFEKEFVRFDNLP